MVILASFSLCFFFLFLAHKCDSPSLFLLFFSQTTMPNMIGAASKGERRDRLMCVLVCVALYAAAALKPL